ncbi:MAG: hypothetical protein KKF12_16375 [Proteobacteria bacterium]|nr:hypothetical protein [Desulfobacula sp.]MBU3953308.1 hypothetical protein [Pseudomonadota bacterium]MBU4132392.1 hypothetical protein [Pseudomonadota bacterium]
MVFDEQFSIEIVKYGVGPITRAGRYHFVAALEGKNKIRQLCLSQQQDLSAMAIKKTQWFSKESSAIKAFQENRKACHKCMRALETLELFSALRKCD